MSRTARLARVWRRRTTRWSQTSDAAFHDGLFAAAPDPCLDFSYVGYATVRRIADLVHPALDGARRVVDFGCGLGEVTCELARRNPTIEFIGLDHSQSGTAKGRDLAARLGLRNVTFEQQSANAGLARPADVGLFLDSFHHLENPREVVERLLPAVPRLVLIEPHGDWKGSWDRRLNLDWLPIELDKLRSRLESSLGLPTTISHEKQNSPTLHGAAVENRYSIAEMVELLAGYRVRVQGTVSGFDVYPPRAHLDTPARHLFNRVLYDLLAHADAEIERHSLGAAAKHWVIVAERSAEGPDPVPPLLPPEPPGGIEPPPAVQGPLDFCYDAYVGPRVLRPNQISHVRLTVTNLSWRPIPSGPAFAVSYHWRRRNGTTVVGDGLRTRFPRPLPPGEAAVVEAVIQAPSARGLYVLAFDVVEEGQAWASDWGVPCSAIKIGIV